MCMKCIGHHHIIMSNSYKCLKKSCLDSLFMHQHTQYVVLLFRKDYNHVYVPVFSCLFIVFYVLILVFEKKSVHLLLSKPNFNLLNWSSLQVSYNNAHKGSELTMRLWIFLLFRKKKMLRLKFLSLILIWRITNEEKWVLHYCIAECYVFVAGVYPRAHRYSLCKLIILMWIYV